MAYSKTTVRVSTKLINLSVKALSQSMTPKIMVSLARELIPNYDIFQRTGIPGSVAIPNVTAAKQIVQDMIARESFLDFILLLVKTSEYGYMGRRYAIPYLKSLINGVIDMGFIYDNANDMFVENPNLRRTRNWGTLKTGKTYTVAFLRIDIVGSSGIVRSHNEKTVHQCYDDLRRIVQLSIEKRNGRIWGWDGDGGLAAFFYGNKNQSAVLAGMEILHEIFLYNYSRNPLSDPLKVRLAVHNGPFTYSPSEEDLKNSDTVKKVEDIEHSLSPPMGLALSEAVQVMLDHSIIIQLSEKKESRYRKYFVYKMHNSNNNRKR